MQLYLLFLLIINNSSATDDDKKTKKGMRVGYYQITNKGLVRYVFVPKALLRSAQFNFDEVFFALNLKTPVSLSSADACESLKAPF